MTATDIFSARLSEPNQLSRLAPWKLDFRQMSAGAGQTDVALRFGRSITALSIEMQCKVHQTGEAPAGLVTLGVPKQGTVRTWLRVEMPEHALICFGSGREFDGVSDAGFRGLTMSILQSELNSLAEAFGLVIPDNAFHPGVFDLSTLPRSAKLFTRKLAAFAAIQQSHHDNELEDDIGLALLLAMPSAETRDNIPAQRLRDLALRRALDVIDAVSDDPPSIRTLCVKSGSSWPTLHRAFVEKFEVGPKTYLSNLRLNRVRTDLLAASNGERVVDIANRWGFWHMGQFAKDYRRMFGELPSGTLGRSC